MNRRTLTFLWLTVSIVFLTGCDLVPMHMRDQPRYDALEQSRFFADGLAARPLPANTIPRGERGEFMLDEALYTGSVAGEFIDTLPVPITEELLERGRQRYNIYCAPCHDRTGSGNGMIVQRGFRQPSSFHIDRLRKQPDGYLYDVITDGFGVMYSYKTRVNPPDRWAIVAYVRALQLSQNATIDDVPESERPGME
jgi:mono/diheme cytochrome c family protein